jgi:tight adherence protein C
MVNILNAIDEPTILISIAGFLVIFLFCIGILQLQRRMVAKRQLLQRIETIGGMVDGPYEKDLTKTNSSVTKRAILNVFINLGRRLMPKKSEDHAIKGIRFLKAGIRNQQVGLIFWGLKCFLVIVFFVTFLMLRLFVFTVMNMQLAIALGVFMPFLGFYLPDIWLLQTTQKRQEKLLKALPDALDLLVVSVEAGMGLDEAINRVAKESKLKSPELSDELAFLGLQLRAGKQRQDALKNMAERTNLEEVKNLVTLLIQADKFGTNIADTLRVYSDSFRNERFQRAEEMASKLPVKLVFPLIMFIFPALFVVILGPAAISIYRHIILR